LVVVVVVVVVLCAAQTLESIRPTTARAKQS